MRRPPRQSRAAGDVGSRSTVRYRHTAGANAHLKFSLLTHLHKGAETHTRSDKREIAAAAKEQRSAAIVTVELFLHFYELDLLVCSSGGFMTIGCVRFRRSTAVLTPTLDISVNIVDGTGPWKDKATIVLLHTLQQAQKSDVMLHHADPGCVISACLGQQRRKCPE